MQCRVPSDLRARVTSLIYAVSSLGTVLSMAVTPALAKLVGWQVRVCGHLQSTRILVMASVKVLVVSMRAAESRMLKCASSAVVSLWHVVDQQTHVWQLQPTHGPGFNAKGSMSAQATFSFSAAAGLLWVAAFPRLLSPQRVRRAAPDSPNTSPWTSPSLPRAEAPDGRSQQPPTAARGNGPSSPGGDPVSVRRKQAQAQVEALAPDTALRVRPGVASRGSRTHEPPAPADDVESCTPPGGARSGDSQSASFGGNGEPDGAKGAAKGRPLQGRAQQAVLLCWMHGAIGYGYFVMQARETQ